MKLPRDVSGAELVAALVRHWGYRKVNQEGSHIVIETQDPKRHRIVVPNHVPVRVGTLNSILRSVAQQKNCTRDEINRGFR